ncbi:hypothetical protein KCM76_16595 [Zooshikella marina]|uniref:Uncharacterized protein n=1 Tax=Zooshikella ganghwensis TaxID=202772 RepID=A0A4P9VMU3_9GAMM|nr:hypothetical protein [Zooshikella ganghwensis]MBU2707615.1 hypothetical protein [Zooshikella ganghwensis]RDH44735.1 hypothetical protein B9G39_15560 [Zooshikella ganghwensis]
MISHFIKLYNYNDDHLDKYQKRRIAVEAALELIKVNASSSTNLSTDMSQLERYVNLIQNALDPDQKAP